MSAPGDALADGGVWCPLLTPLRGTEAIDRARYLAHARRVLDDGCQGVAVFGTTGEANSLALGARLGLLAALAEEDLPAQRVMVGTGCCALGDTLALSRAALSAGYLRFLVLPPFYYKKVSDEGLYRYYAALVEALGEADTKIYLYNFPQLSGVALAPSLLARLRRDFGGVFAGVKDSSGDWNSVAAYLRECPGAAVFPGSESLLRRGLEAGAAGCITATANVNAAGIRAVYDAFRAGAPALEALDERMRSLRAAIESRPPIAALRHLTARACGEADWRRPLPPLVELSPDEAGALEEDLARLGWGGPAWAGPAAV